MMFEFDSEEQAAFRTTISNVAEKEVTNFLTKQQKDAFPRELFTAFGKQGLSGIAIEEAYGGIKAPMTTRALVVEELSAVNLGPAIFLSVHNMVAGIIGLFGNDEQKKQYLPDLASGKKLAAFALSESQAGSDAAALRTTASPQDNCYTLNGSKCWITSAGFADLYLVFAKTSPEAGKNGISAFLVENNTEGLSFGTPEKKMGCALSPIATMQFDNVKVGKEQLLGEENTGYKIALSGLNGGRINIAAAAVGLARTAIQHGLNHLEERKQFGQPLIEFQGLQFMLADMKMKYESARMLTWRAARAVDTGDKEKRLHASIAKCAATDAAMAITTDAVQLLGGAGYVEEYKVEQLMRDAKMLQIVEGTNQIQRLLIAKGMRNT